MSDTIRWCFTCHEQPTFRGYQYVACGDAELRGHDVADALVIRADQDVYRITTGPQDMGMSAVYLLTPEGLAYQGVLVRIGDNDEG